jgi:DNA-binding response OmpR family regulator
MRVMIVEDEGIIADHIASLLKKAGHVVAGISASGEEVLEMVGELYPDLVLMDIRIEGRLDGIQTADKLRENSDVPVIFLSAQTDAPTMARVKASGRPELLRKPINKALLLNAVQLNTRRIA